MFGKKQLLLERRFRSVHVINYRFTDPSDMKLFFHCQYMAELIFLSQINIKTINILLVLHVVMETIILFTFNHKTAEEQVQQYK